jgi:antitoxin (DNA-binding transcriptional repressor) of toxin-antitoxin stability system
MDQATRMHEVSSTEAKQSFGQLLKAASAHPVAILKHDKVQAIVAAPSYFAAAAQSELAARRLARAEQAIVERDRLIKHQRIALRLLTAPAAERRRLVERARAMVKLWRARRLCSDDYIERWTAILSLPPRKMALAIVSDPDGWGTALRQNSPWVGAIE